MRTRVREERGDDGTDDKMEMRNYGVVLPAVKKQARVEGCWENHRKKVEKTFGKMWKITEKVLTFAAVFRKGRGAGRGAILDKNRKNMRKNKDENRYSAYL